MDLFHVDDGRNSKGNREIQKEICGNKNISWHMVVRIIVSRDKPLKEDRSLHTGFTLWELMLVLFLMGVLLTVVTPHFGSAASQVRLRVNLANIQKIEGAAQLYRLDVGTYPRSVSDLVHYPMGTSEWHGPYLNEIPLNPFDSVRGYQIDSLGQVK